MLRAVDVVIGAHSVFRLGRNKAQASRRALRRIGERRGSGYYKQPQNERYSPLQERRRGKGERHQDELYLYNIGDDDFESHIPSN